MSQPPHLPPKTCSVPLYRRMMTSSALIVLTCIALASGVVGGIVADVYFSIDQTFYTGSPTGQITSGKANTTDADPLFVRSQQRRTLSLVPKAQYEQTGQIPVEGTIEAVVLTDSGWFVAPQFATALNASNMLAVTSEGERFDIGTLVTDATYGLAYGSLEGSGFRVAPFAPAASLTPGMNLWASKHGTLERTYLTHGEKNTTALNTYAPGTDAYVFRAASVSSPGTILWTEEGAFFGFVNQSGVIVPWFVVESTYTNVFTGGTIDHTVLPVEGYLVQLSEEAVARTGAKYGFYVTAVAAGEAVTVGDTITHIAEQTFGPETLQRIVTEAGETMPLRILRDGERVDVIVKKQSL